VLCTIKYDSNGVLMIRPDFNKGRKAYKVETAGIGKGQSFYVNLTVQTIVDANADGTPNFTDNECLTIEDNKCIKCLC